MNFKKNMFNKFMSNKKKENEEINQKQIRQNNIMSMRNQSDGSSESHGKKSLTSNGLSSEEIEKSIDEQSSTVNESANTEVEGLIKKIPPRTKFFLIGGIGSVVFIIIIFLIVMIVPLMALGIIDIEDIISESGGSSSSLAGYSNVNESNGYSWPVGTTTDNITYDNGEPASTTITSHFGSQEDFRTKGHGAIDIGNGGYGPGVINIISVKSGKVIYPTSSYQIAYNDNGSLKNNDGGGFGNYVKIEHADGSVAIYAHLAKNSITVFAGDEVKQGQVIGKMGHSGRSTGAHLHFEIRVNGIKVDPMNYISKLQIKE